MKGSKLLLLVVVMILVAVVVAKQTRRSFPAPEPFTTAQAPPQSAHDESVSAPTPENEAEAPAPEQLTAPAVPKNATRENPKPAPHPEQSKPKPEDPLKQPKTPVPGDLAKPASIQQPPSQPAPETIPAPEPGPEVAPHAAPEPEGPLPGSKLEECLKSGRPTMADFGLRTCKPCKAMEPILKQAVQDYSGKANIVFVELDKYPVLGRKYRIMVMPTQIFFDASGNQVDSHMGFMDREEIDRRLAALGVKQ